MVFPATILDLRVEVLLGSLGWTDISAYVRQRDPVTGTRGWLPSSSPSSLPPPSTASLTLRNDGRFSPRNPSGPWYGLIGRNTQLRISVPDGAGGRKYRFWGEVPAWPPEWDVTGTDVYARIQASGILRRLGQGTQPPLDSPWKRGMLRLAGSAMPIAYWPGEDGTGAGQIASGLPGGTPMRVTGTPAYASDAGFPASQPIPLISKSTWTGTIPPHAADTANVLRWFMHVPAGGAVNQATIIRLHTAGGLEHADVFYDATIPGVKAQVFDANGASVIATAALAVAGQKLLMSLELAQSGADITITLAGMTAAGMITSVTATALTRTIGQGTRVIVNPATGVNPVDDTAAGQISYQGTLVPLSSLSSLLAAWAGETAGSRFARLCAEQGVPFVTKGSIADTEPMGIQTPLPFLQLLAECADADQGIIYEPRGGRAAGTGGTGAFLSEGGMGVADFNAAKALWDSWTGRSMKVTRAYLAQSSFVYNVELQRMAAAGVKVLLTIRPAYAPVSSADLAAMITLLQAMQAAGMQAEVALWHEPVYSGLSQAQFQAMIAYYGPFVRQYYPLVFVTANSAVLNNGEGAYFVAGAFDKAATDYYCGGYENGELLDTIAAIADGASPPLPFGLWEYNALVNGANRLSGTDTTFEGSTGNWTAAGNSATADSSAQANTGTFSMAVTSQAAGAMAAASCTAANILTKGIPCAAGDSISCSAWFRAAATGRTVQAGATFYTSAGVLISTIYGTGMADTTTGWTQASGPVTAPATSAFCRLSVQVSTPAAAGEVHYVDDAFLTNLSAGFSTAQVTSFFGYVKSFFDTRAAAGKQNADLLLFNGSGINSSLILGASDFRIALWQAQVDDFASASAAASLALGYRTRASLQSQAPALTLAYDQAQLSPPLQPVDDDQQTVNDVTVTRAYGGSSARAQVTAGALSVQPPPNGVGPYQDTPTLNLASDSRAADFAGWLAHVGTTDELRYPSIGVDLARPQLAAVFYACQDLDIGDRLAVTGLPAWLPPGSISQLVLGMAETLFGYTFAIQWNGVPESPWQTGIVGDAVYAQADTDGSTLHADVTSGATSMTVDTAVSADRALALWTTDGANMPFDIAMGGERITVTAISGAANPQTFTITRSVNGVVKAHTAGEPVVLYFPTIIGL